MLEKKIILKVQAKEYRLAFTFNCLEKIQEKYETVSEWMNLMFPDGESYPDVKLLKEALFIMANEGALIDYFETNCEKVSITLEEVDYICALLDKTYLVIALNDALIGFFGEEDDDTEEDMEDDDPNE